MPEPTLMTDGVSPEISWEPGVIFLKRSHQMSNPFTGFPSPTRPQPPQHHFRDISFIWHMAQSKFPHVSIKCVNPLLEEGRYRSLLRSSAFLSPLFLLWCVVTSTYRSSLLLPLQVLYMRVQVRSQGYVQATGTSLGASIRMMRCFSSSSAAKWCWPGDLTFLSLRFLINNTG